MSVSVEPLRRQKDTDILVRVFCLVGVARLELAALRSRTVRATKLRYTPIEILSCRLPHQNRNGCPCLVARLALTEGFARNKLFRGFVLFRFGAYASRHFSQPKLRYTPIEILSCRLPHQNRNGCPCLVARLALTEGFAWNRLSRGFVLFRFGAYCLTSLFATQTALHPDGNIEFSVAECSIILATFFADVKKNRDAEHLSSIVSPIL